MSGDSGVICPANYLKDPLASSFAGVKIVIDLVCTWLSFNVCCNKTVVGFSNQIKKLRLQIITIKYFLFTEKT